MSLLPLVGLLAGFCFAYCGVPAAYATVKAGRSVGTPVSIAWMIVLGTVSMYAYLTAMHGFDPVITLNYSVEGLSWGPSCGTTILLGRESDVTDTEHREGPYLRPRFPLKEVDRG